MIQCKWIESHLMQHHDHHDHHDHHHHHHMTRTNIANRNSTKQDQYSSTDERTIAQETIVCLFVWLFACCSLSLEVFHID